MVPASFDFWLANLNREASSTGTSIPSESLNPTARLSGSPSIHHPELVARVAEIRRLGRHTIENMIEIDRQVGPDQPAAASTAMYGVRFWRRQLLHAEWSLSELSVQARSSTLKPDADVGLGRSQCGYHAFIRP